MKVKFTLIFLTSITVLAFGYLIACDSSDDDDDSSTDDDDNYLPNDDDNNDDDVTSDDDNDDDSDDDTQSDDDSAEDVIPECEIGVNTEPELYAVNLIVNGEIVEQPYTATTDDEIAISLEYFDAECNIECIPGYTSPRTKGKLYIVIDQRDFENLSEDAYNQLNSHSWLLPGIGCSSEESGPYVIELDPQSWVVDENEVRQYPLIVELTDGCRAGSGSDTFIDFTVHAAK